MSASLETKQLGYRVLNVIFAPKPAVGFQPKDLCDVGVYLRDTYPEEWGAIAWSTYAESGFCVFYNENFPATHDIDRSASIRMYSLGFETPYERFEGETFTNEDAVKFYATSVAPQSEFITVGFRHAATRRMVVQFARAVHRFGFRVISTDGCRAGFAYSNVQWTSGRCNYYSRAEQNHLRSALKIFNEEQRNPIFYYNGEPKKRRRVE